MAVTRGIPRGPLRLAHTTTSFDLVTIQQRDVYAALERDGVAYPDPARSGYLTVPEFAQAYRWMARTLHDTRDTHDRFDPTQGAMFWLWAHVTREALTHDAREYGPGHVALRCRIPRERVLLSDFSAYHGILNEDIVWTSEEIAAGYADDEYLPPLYRELDDTYGNGWRLDQLARSDRERVEATWKHALVHEPPKRGDWTQACVARLELGDVTDVYELDACTALNSTALN